jgi:hypothetical protein
MKMFRLPYHAIYNFQSEKMIEYGNIEEEP